VRLSAGFRNWNSVLQISTLGVQLELQLEFHKAHKNCSLVFSSRNNKNKYFFYCFLFVKTSIVGVILIPTWLFPSKVRTPTGNSNWAPIDFRSVLVCYRFGCSRSPIWLSELHADFRWSPGVVWRHECVRICCPQKVRLLDLTKWSEMYAFAIDFDPPGARSGSLRSRRISDLRKIVEIS
jgi:hypothetical protein